MKASAFEFRFRYLIHGVIFALGFWAPWNMVLHLDPPGVNAHVWGILAVNLTQVGVQSLFTAFNILLIIAIAFALASALLRTWGGAYLAEGVVSSRAMHTDQSAGDGILKDGPYRYLRNPLYLGTFLHSIAVALLMPRSGAIFTIAAIGLFQLRLIYGEEAFLTAKLGAPYQAYCALVPRLLPVLRAKVRPAGLVPHWGSAVLGEVYFWGVALSLALVGWRYNAALIIQCVVVSFGVSLVVNALLSRKV